MSYETALQSLQRRWAVVAACYALGLLGLGLFLRQQLTPWQTGLWLGLSGLISFYILTYLYLHLPDNIPSGELMLSPRLGPGTVLSLVGGWLIAAMGGFIVVTRPQGVVAWLPALFFLGALMADLFDGFLARRSGLATRLGADLDMTLDGLGVLLASALAVRWGQWPFWYITVGLARYLYVGGIAWRQRHELPVFPTQDNVTRRLLAGLQRGYLFVSLWPVVPAWVVQAIGPAFVVPFLANFLFDWLITSGVLDDTDPEFQRVFRRWQGWMLGPVALGLRILAVVAGSVAIGQAAMRSADFSHGLVRMLGMGTSVGMALLAAGIVFSGLLLLGVLPRLMAVLLYAPLTIIMMTEVSFWPAWLAIYAITGVILLGPGPYALWQPEARFFTRRLGS